MTVFSQPNPQNTHLCDLSAWHVITQGTLEVSSWCYLRHKTSLFLLCVTGFPSCVSQREKGKKMKEQKKEKRGSQRDGKGEEGCVG